MAKQHYTILIVSQKAAQVKKFILSPLTLKISAVLLTAFLVIFSFIIYEYVMNKRKVVELHQLRSETQSQQAELHSFFDKISVLEEQLNRLKEMEKKVEKEVKEFNELKRIKRAKKVSLLAGKNKSSLTKIQEINGPAQIRKGGLSILEQERPRLVSRLHQDLQELQKEMSHREKILMELQEFLEAKKSILLAIPSLWPVWGRITSAFGDTRTSALAGGTRPHRGVDISAPSGTPILAAADGVVTFAGQESEYGRLVCLDHGQGFTTMYGHLKELFVQTGDKILKGQHLGTVGVSGNSTGPHLHYEVRLHGNPIDPVRYLNQTS